MSAAPGGRERPRKARRQRRSACDPPMLSELSLRPSGAAGPLSPLQPAVGGSPPPLATSVGNTAQPSWPGDTAPARTVPRPLSRSPLPEARRPQHAGREHCVRAAGSEKLSSAIRMSSCMSSLYWNFCDVRLDAAFYL